MLLSTQLTFAATMYRCGNSFQDTPCTNKNKSTQSPTKANSSPTQQSTAPTLKVDADCKQRGDDAKKIMWLREAGKTQTQQIESAPNHHAKTLVKDVYNLRGTSLEVKNAIEQACMQQKEQDKLANQLMLEAQRLKSNGIHPTITPVNDQAHTESLPKTSKASESQLRVNDDDANNISDCLSLKNHAEYIATQRRRGGNAYYMNDLKQKQTEIEASIRTSGC